MPFPVLPCQHAVDLPLTSLQSISLDMFYMTDPAPEIIQDPAVPLHCVTKPDLVAPFLYITYKYFVPMTVVQLDLFGIAHTVKLKTWSF